MKTRQEKSEFNKIEHMLQKTLYGVIIMVINISFR